jgi:hypothetical protein
MYNLLMAKKSKKAQGNLVKTGQKAAIGLILAFFIGTNIFNAKIFYGGYAQFGSYSSIDLVLILFNLFSVLILPLFVFTVFYKLVSRKSKNLSHLTLVFESSLVALAVFFVTDFVNYFFILGFYSVHLAVYSRAWQFFGFQFIIDVLLAIVLTWLFILVRLPVKAAVKRKL